MDPRVGATNFPKGKIRTYRIARKQDCNYVLNVIYSPRYASRQHWAVYLNSTPSDEVTWENSTWNEHQLGSIHIIRILANHNRRNSTKSFDLNQYYYVLFYHGLVLLSQG